MEERKRLGIDNEMLFVSKRKGQYVAANTSSANSFASKISKMFDIDYYNHSSRHYFCTLLKSMNLPDDVIVQIFSWAGSEMIKIYDDTPAEEKLSKYFAQFLNTEEVKGE